MLSSHLRSWLRAGRRGIFYVTIRRKPIEFAPFCRTQYTVLPERSGEPQIETERRLSGICSRKCWREGTGTDEKEWLGHEADSVVMDAKGKGVMVRKDGKLASTFADGKGAVVHTPLSDAAARELENRGPQLRTCANCRATGDWSICSGCRLAHYCSPDCQRGHWKLHKAECKRQAEMLALALHRHETGQWNDSMLTGGARLAVSRM